MRPMKRIRERRLERNLKLFSLLIHNTGLLKLHWTIVEKYAASVNARATVGPGPLKSTNP